MRRCAQIAVCCVIFAIAAASEVSADSSPGTYRIPSNSEVIGYLLQSVNWYRHLYAERQVAREPADLMFLDDNQAIERQIVKLSFEFAKADAAVATSATFSQGNVTASDSAPSDLARFVELQKQNDRLSQQATQEIEDLDIRLAGAKAADRGKLKALQEDAQTRLQLLTAVAQTLTELIEFVQGSGEGESRSGHWDSTIDDLAQSIPEVMGTAVTSTTLALEQPNSRMSGSSAGILGLITDVTATSHKLRVVEEKIRLTENLTESQKALRIPMSDFVTHLVQRVAASTAPSADLGSLREEKSHLDMVTLNLKELLPVLVALDKQKVLLAEYESHLQPWRNAVMSQYRQAWRQLVIRVIIVLSIIGLLLAIGQLSRRFTLRRIDDPNRRRFISMSHQILTLFAITIVIVFVLASDLRSVATYFGLLSAGLLLALENVILSTLGSLLLVGKRGIRIGDRVQVSGVTGDVIDMGLLQFQLREFDVESGRFTGHVATFSNSLVFVSPATGLVRFDPAPEKSSHAGASSRGTGPQAKGPVSIAGPQG